MGYPYLRKPLIMVQTSQKIYLGCFSTQNKDIVIMDEWGVEHEMDNMTISLSNFWTRAFIWE